jgi:hypothetical protein
MKKITLATTLLMIGSSQHAFAMDQSQHPYGAPGSYPQPSRPKRHEQTFYNPENLQERKFEQAEKALKTDFSIRTTELGMKQNALNSQAIYQYNLLQLDIAKVCLSCIESKFTSEETKNNAHIFLSHWTAYINNSNQ